MLSHRFRDEDDSAYKALKDFAPTESVTAHAARVRSGGISLPWLARPSIARRSGYFFWHPFMHMSYSVLHVFAE
jgi:hypothetical protein